MGDEKLLNLIQETKVPEMVLLGNKISMKKMKGSGDSAVRLAHEGMDWKLVRLILFEIYCKLVEGLSKASE